MMPRARRYTEEEDRQAYERGRQKLEQLLVNPKEFERWANEMLDESIRRRRR